MYATRANPTFTNPGGTRGGVEKNEPPPDFWVAAHHAWKGRACNKGYLPQEGKIPLGP